MDNAMVKRGIGAVVLAIIAALLLGYLLKDKSREREEVVMKLPNAPEMNIPSLTGNMTDSPEVTTETPTLLESATATVTNATESVADTLKDTGSSVVASATGALGGATDTVKTAMDSTSSAIQSNKPGFAIRPSLQNEEKEIVDATNTESSTETPTLVEEATETKDSVVASSNSASNSANNNAEKKTFKPQIVENKPVKKAAPKKPVAPAKPKAPVSSVVSSTPIGKYSIQLLATSSQSRANKLANTMKGEGYKVFVTQATREDKILYRVRVGGHADRSKALKAQEGMKRRYQKNFFVQNSLVISN